MQYAAGRHSYDRREWGGKTCVRVLIRVPYRVDVVVVAGLSFRKLPGTTNADTQFISVQFCLCSQHLLLSCRPPPHILPLSINICAYARVCVLVTAENDVAAHKPHSDVLELSQMLIPSVLPPHSTSIGVWSTR
jgi:hypothetical protein